MAAASRVTREQEVTGQGQQPVRSRGQQRGVDHAEIKRGRQHRVAQEVAHDPVLQQGQRLVGLMRREEVPGRPPHVSRGLEPLAGPQLQLLLAGLVPSPQLGAQQLAHQMVEAEAGPLIVEGH